MATKKKTEKSEGRGGLTFAVYLIISVIAAIAIWSYITLVENPEVTQPVSDVPIIFIGEDTLAENDLMLVSVNTRDLNLSFTGKWNTVTGLTAQNVSATVDLSSIVTRGSSAPGTYQLAYTVNFENALLAQSVTRSGADYDYVTVTVEKTITKTIPLKASYSGTVMGDYMARSLEYSPLSITVSGPQIQVEEIYDAYASFTRDEITGTVVEDCDIVLRDANENILSEDGLTLSQNSVTLTLPVLMRKSVPLAVNLIYGVSNSEENTAYTVDPPSVIISGDAEILSELTEITIGTVDTTRSSRNGTQDFSIRIPEGCTNESGVVSAKVNWQVSGLSVSRFSTVNIAVEDLTEGYAARIITRSVDVTLRGTELALSGITAEDISVVASLSELGSVTGQSNINASVTVAGHPDVDVIGNYDVIVEIYIPTEGTDVVKVVPLTATPLYGSSNSEADTVITIEPKSITLLGDAQSLESIEEINVGTVDTTSSGLSGSQEFAVKAPEGTVNYSDISSVTVTWRVSGLSTKVFSTPGISADAVRNGYYASVTSRSLDVTLRGTAEELERIKDSEITVKADVSGVTGTGQYIVPAEVTLSGHDSVDIIGEYSVVVELSFAPEPEPEG